jgi:hypothetical protein
MNYIAGGVEWSKTQMDILRLFARAAYQGDPQLGERLVRPVADTMLAMVEEILLSAIERGEVRDDLPPETLARYVHAFTIAAGDSLLMPYLNEYFQVYEGRPDSAQITGTLIDLLIEGIAPRGESG